MHVIFMEKKKNALKELLLAYRVGAFWLTSMNSWEGLPMVSNLPKYLGSGFGRKSKHSLPTHRELIDLTGVSNGFMTPPKYNTSLFQRVWI